MGLQGALHALVFQERDSHKTVSLYILNMNVIIFLLKKLNEYNESSCVPKHNNRIHSIE